MISNDSKERGKEENIGKDYFSPVPLHSNERILKINLSDKDIENNAKKYSPRVEEKSNHIPVNCDRKSTREVKENDKNKKANVYKYYSNSVQKDKKCYSYNNSNSNSANTSNSNKKLEASVHINK